MDWSELHWADLEEEPGEFAPLIEKLKSLTLNITLGIRGEYVLASLGASNEHLARLGKGTLLADRPELKPLAAFSKERLTSVAFASADLRRAGRTSKADIHKLAASVAGLLADLGLEEALRKRILDDIQAFAADIRRYVPDVGAAMGFSFLTERGFEGYAYDWSQHLAIDGSKPLELADHLGGNPLAALVTRSKYDPEHGTCWSNGAGSAMATFRSLDCRSSTSTSARTLRPGGRIAPAAYRVSRAATRDLMLPALCRRPIARCLGRQAGEQTLAQGDAGCQSALAHARAGHCAGSDRRQAAPARDAEYRAIANEAIDAIRRRNPGRFRPIFACPRVRSPSRRRARLSPFRSPSRLASMPRSCLHGPERKAAREVDCPPAHRVAAGKQHARIAQNAWRRQASAGRIGLVRLGANGRCRAAVDTVRSPSSAGRGSVGDEVPEELDPQSQFILDQVRTTLETLKVLRTYASVAYTDNGASSCTAKPISRTSTSAATVFTLRQCLEFRLGPLCAGAL